MSRVEAAAAMDRLPWLPDEPKPQAAKRRSIAIWAAGGVLAVAAGGFWVGENSIQQPPPILPKRAQPATAVPLPKPHPAQPQVAMTAEPQVKPAPQPQVRPAPVREVRIYAPVERPVARETEPAISEKKAPEPIAKAAANPTPIVAQPAQPFVLPRPWNPRVLAGAAGRVVQIGAFGSVHQSKEGWRYMVRAYPAVARLPAVVRPSTNSKGRAFYRFQVGTTSQAHSEVLCQRMEKIHLSCAVVGLPWKAKVER